MEIEVKGKCVFPQAIFVLILVLIFYLCSINPQ